MTERHNSNYFSVNLEKAVNHGAWRDGLSTLETLKGVAAKAEAIIEDRNKNGPLNSVDDLNRVKGCGKKSVDKPAALPDTK